jgi:hypothetical protein
MTRCQSGAPLAPGSIQRQAERDADGCPQREPIDSR